MENITNNDFELLSMALPQDILSFKYNGDFEGEIKAIDGYLNRQCVTEALRRRMLLEKRIAQRLCHDYRQSESVLIENIKKDYPHFDKASLEEIKRKGHADYIIKNGVCYYQNDAECNIKECCYRYLNSLEGNIIPVNDWADTKEHIKIMKEKGSRAFKYRVKFSLKLHPEAEREGEILRIHFPYPQSCPEQTEITLLSSSDKVYISDASQRTAYIEAPCVKGKEYYVELSFIHRSKYTELSPDNVNNGEYKNDMSYYLEEKLPHIAFTPYLKSLAKEIVGEETNRLLIAKKIYRWISENVRYSYMRDYFCLDSIAENCALNNRGDCGVQELLFITLCRICGIPARFNSGMSVRPGHIGSHDWGQFYIEPYGWLYTDMTRGTSATNDGHLDIADYYLGNFDCFRFVANTDFQAPFDPPKKFLREDPFDNQWGEVEYTDREIAPFGYHFSRELIECEEVE